MQPPFATLSLLVALSNLSLLTVAAGDDWARFRGPAGSGIAQGAAPPLTWDDSNNLRWKVELPGPGSSSPIVIGKNVFVTCYSGYGIRQSDGEPNQLKRHLLCINRLDGKTLWTATVAAELPEDPYQGYISEHGYASSTPTSDGERIYCFFGKSGVVAFDFDGNRLWHADVGKESSNRRWGSAASLILHRDSLIVNASEESQSIIALDKSTGQTRWKSPASTLELAYGTPSIVTTSDGRDELVVAVPGEVWGLNPDTGKLTWFAEHNLTGNICPSIFADGETVFVFGGFRSSGSLAVRAGGEGDVTRSRLLWSSSDSSYVATPILHQGHLYWTNDAGIAFCIDAKTGNQVYRERLRELQEGGRPVYASPVIAADKIYLPSRWDGVLVLAAKPSFEDLAQNRFAADDSDFNATPAISDGELFLRSNRFLYCVAETDSK
jgi:outer membrane protein assembly factor BamB